MAAEQRKRRSWPQEACDYRPNGPTRGRVTRWCLFQGGRRRARRPRSDAGSFAAPLANRLLPCRVATRRSHRCRSCQGRRTGSCAYSVSPRERASDAVTCGYAVGSLKLCLRAAEVRPVPGRTDTDDDPLTRSCRFSPPGRVSVAIGALPAAAMVTTGKAIPPGDRCGVSGVRVMRCYQHTHPRARLVTGPGTSEARTLRRTLHEALIRSRCPAAGGRLDRTLEEGHVQVPHRRLATSCVRPYAGKTR